MTDLVERLRERADYEGYPGSTLILQAADEIEQLRERCNPSKVVKIGDVGHYVSEAVYAEIERLQARVTELEQAVAAEREACIAECERIAAGAWYKWEQEADGHSRSNAVGAFACIEVIRARGEKPASVAAVCGADCHPGDALCNNYCNLAPQKGPMAKLPPALRARGEP